MAKSKRAAERPMPVEIEPVDHLRGRHDLVVAVAPAEPHEIVAQRGRQIAHLAVGLDAERAVALRQLGAVGPVDQRHVREDRHLPAHGRVDLRLARGVGQVVDAADDVRDLHVVVVDDDGEIVGRGAVAAQDDEVVELLVGEHDAALHLIVDHGLALARRLEPDHVGLPPAAPRRGRGRARGCGSSSGRFSASAALRMASSSSVVR